MKKQCQNGGVLVQNKGVFTCQCPHNYYGELCADGNIDRTISFGRQPHTRLQDVPSVFGDEYSTNYMFFFFFFLFVAERYFSTVSRLIGGAWFDGANEDMRRGAPKMWWWQSLFSTTDPAERYQKTVISCKHNDPSHSRQRGQGTCT
jgi:hypothetical protein